jgi:hypothetical protein
MRINKQKLAVQGVLSLETKMIASVNGSRRTTGKQSLMGKF